MNSKLTKITGNLLEPHFEKIKSYEISRADIYIYIYIYIYMYICIYIYIERERDRDRDR